MPFFHHFLFVSLAFCYPLCYLSFYVLCTLSFCVPCNHLKKHPPSVSIFLHYFPPSQILSQHFSLFRLKFILSNPPTCLRRSIYLPLSNRIRKTISRPFSCSFHFLPLLPQILFHILPFHSFLRLHAYTRTPIPCNTLYHLIPSFSSGTSLLYRTIHYS